EKGADVKKAARSGRTPLRAAIFGGHKEVVEFLIAKGADAAEHEALRDAVGLGRKELVELLLSKGAKVSRPEDRYGSLLRTALTENRLDMVKLLLDKGADAKKDPQLLHHAAVRGNKPAVEALLAAGADVNETTFHGYDIYLWKLSRQPEVLE